MRALTLSLLAFTLAFGTAAPAQARTRSVDCGLVCSESIGCGRDLQPTCTSGSACDAGYVAFTLPDPVVYHCPSFPCSGNDVTFTQGCYDPLNPPTCDQCSAWSQYQCVPSTNCGGRCDPWLTPDADGYCQSCGDVEEVPCADGEGPCQPGLFLAGGHCYPDGCGDTGETACGPITAAECYAWNNLIPLVNQCVACGDESQVTCNSGSPCRSGLQDEFDSFLGYSVCSNCGGVNERVCVGGDPCREGGARAIGPNSLGVNSCGLCGGADAILACASSTPCDAGFHRYTTAGLSGDISACVGGGETAHFVEQNGICSPALPTSMTRPAPEAWPAQEESAAGRNTVLILHGRGSDCGGSMGNLLTAGGVYGSGHLVYCVEYAQEGVPGIDRREVRILPVLDDVLGNPDPPCTSTGTCAFDEAHPVADVFASAYDVPSVASALAEEILNIPIEGEITLIGHSQGGFVARELVYRHYDDLRWAGKNISRVITLAHPYYGKQYDAHLYTPWLCARNDSFDCATGEWLWGWDLYAPGAVTDADYPQIEWTAVSGGGFVGGTTGEDADGDGDHDAADDACLYLFGGVVPSSVVGDTSVPIESSLGYDEFGWFAVPNLPFDRKVHTTCTHTAACLMSQAEFDPVPCLPGGGLGSPPDSCSGMAAVPAVLPYSTDPPRPHDALEFDGVDDRVTIDDPAAVAALDIGSHMTLDAWVHPMGPGNTANGTGGIILNKEGEYWLGRWADGRIAWAVADGNWVARLSTAVLPEREWSHVALTYDGAGTHLAKLYVNGRFVQEWSVGASIGDVNTSENRLDIGQRAAGSQPFDGQIDDVRVWGTTLDASQISSILNGQPIGLGADPIVWYRFDEDADTVVDSSGHGYHGSIATLGPNATPMRRRTRRLDKKGGALYLDGVDDRAVIDDPAAVARLTMHDKLTIEGWMFLRGYGAATMLVVNEGSYWLATAPDGRLGFAVANTSPGWVGVYGSYVVPLRTWTHVAFVYDNDPATNTGTARLYANGQFEQEWSVAGPVGDVNGTNGLGLGGRGPGGNNVHGTIDEVRIWSVARTAQDIASQYNRTLTYPETEIGLAGYWTFDERDGPIAFDHSGHGNHAHLGDGAAASVPYRGMAPQLPGFRLIYAGDCGNGTLDPSEDCDDGGATGGDGCSASCRTETALDIAGTPQGGTVSIDIAGRTIQVTTSAGQTSADVAAAIAAAIEGDAVLASLGIHATSLGDQVFIGAPYTNVTITDPGVMNCDASVPFPFVDGVSMNACPETGVTLATEPGRAAYQWLRDGQPIPGANDPTYGATLTGSYRVRVGDGAGCERESFAALTFVTFCPDTEISPPRAVFPLRVETDAAATTGYDLTFQGVDGADGYALYEGTIGSWYDHGAAAMCQIHACSTPGTPGCYDDTGTGQLRVAFTPSPGDHYYLVTGYQGSSEGPAGSDSAGAPRDPAQSTCPP